MFMLRNFKFHSFLHVSINWLLDSGNLNQQFGQCRNRSANLSIYRDYSPLSRRASPQLTPRDRYSHMMCSSTRLDAEMCIFGYELRAIHIKGTKSLKKHHILWHINSHYIVKRKRFPAYFGSRHINNRLQR